MDHKLILTLLYILIIREQIVSEECPDFRFGVNCTGTCHCGADDPRCRTEDGSCYSSDCAQGYQEPPLCQNECDEGFFHTNCDLTCHCPIGDTCNRVNGACSSNKCHPGYGGAGCQIQLPRLISAPNVTDISCNGATVSWPDWRKGEDIGDEHSVIHSYDLYKQNSSSLGWDFISSISHRNIPTYRELVTDLVEGEQYKFRVDVRRYTGGDMGKRMPTADGFPTDYIPISCPETPDSTTKKSTLPSTTSSLLKTTKSVTKKTTPRPTYSKTPQITRVDASETTLTVTVSPPSITFGVLTKYMVSVSTDDTFSSPVSVEYQASVTTFVVENLSPYTVYYTKVRVRTKAGWGDYSEVVKSETEQDYPDAPSQISPSPSYKNESCLEFSWSEPDIKNGLLYGYKILHYPMSNPDNQNVIKVNRTVNLVHNLCSLLPGQKYMISVAAQTAKGYGKAISTQFYTEVGTPMIPPSPTLVKTTYTTIVINLDPVVLNTGPLSAYHVIVEEIMNNETNKRAASNVTSTNSPDDLIPRYITAMFPGDAILKKLTFTVGDDKQYGGYQNAALKQEHLYNVYYKVISTLQGITKSSMSMMEGPIKTVVSDATISGTERNGIIAGVIFAIVLSVAALLVISWRYYKAPPDFKPCFPEKTNNTLSVNEKAHPSEHWSKIYCLVDSLGFEQNQIS